MTLLDILSQAVVGKRIVSGGPVSANGATILYVKLNQYEPIFEVGVRFPSGRVAEIDILENWDLVLDSPVTAL